jgi:glutathione synthase/RimK-type ligase-like ATP-grasp enzyme
MLLRSGNAMVQPFLTSVITDLERSIVLINGEIISAFTKPAFNTNSAGKTRLRAHHPMTDEVDLAFRVISCLERRATFARVDITPTEEGPMLMEIELIEPDLGLRLAPGAAATPAIACMG